MKTSRRLVPVLQGITLIALIVSALLLVWPPRVTVGSEAPTLPTLAAQVPDGASGAAALTDSVVDANIFSVTREAPDERTFVAAATDGVVTDVTSGEYGADAGLMDSTMAGGEELEPVPALYGIVNGPAGRSALLRLDPSARSARLFQLGEGAGGFRVRSIGSDRVELTGPSGSVVLELVAKGGTS
jgi:hypothetical protein